jgi:DNA-binding NarL/FixJ family response regulator
MAPTEPTFGLVTWREAPGGHPVVLRLAAADRQRQHRLAVAFGDHVVASGQRHLRAIPAAAVVGATTLLDHRADATLHAPVSVVLGGDDDVERALTLLRAGADALLPPDASASDLRDAVYCVLRGEAVVPAAVATAVVRCVRAAERAA